MSRLAEPPHSDVIGACGDLHRLKGVELIPPAIALELEAKAAPFPLVNAAVAELALQV